MIHSLFRLPECVLLDVIHSQLDFCEIVDLDTAFCNKNDRPFLLKAIRHPTISTDAVTRRPKTHGYWYTYFLFWMVLKNMKVKRLGLHFMECHRMGAAFLKDVDLSNVTHFDFQHGYEPNEEIYLTLVQRCPKLAHLTVGNNSEFVLKNLPANILEQLRSLDIKAELALSAETMTRIALHCRKLQEFHWTCTGTATELIVNVDELLTQIINNNLDTLTTLNITKCFKNYNTILQALGSCTNTILKKVSMVYAGDSSISLVNECELLRIVQSCQNLEILTLYKLDQNEVYVYRVPGLKGENLVPLLRENAENVRKLAWLKIK